MTAEKLITDKASDREMIEELAGEINEEFNTGDNQLTSIKVSINPEHRKANIYASYKDKSRVRPNGSEDSTANSCDRLIPWLHSESLENTEESWTDFSYPKRQMERAFLLSEQLKRKFTIVYDKEELNCYIKDGKAYIEKV
ncbi:MAG: hypothetical protein NTX92_09480 [Euryarchaeota archaeon]|nr:hypothetical protein [Euryarchaeota archaeon]